MKSRKKTRQPIRYVVQSATDPERWCVDLACGHSFWIKRKSRPSTSLFLACRHDCPPRPPYWTSVSSVRVSAPRGERGKP